MQILNNVNVESVMLILTVLITILVIMNVYVLFFRRNNKDFNLIGTAFLQSQAELSGRLKQLGEQQSLELKIMDESCWP